MNKDFSKTKLYRKLKTQVRKSDHAELLRMLNLIDPKHAEFEDCEFLGSAFIWRKTPQGFAYWSELRERIRDADLKL